MWQVPYGCLEHIAACQLACHPYVVNAEYFYKQGAYVARSIWDRVHGMENCAVRKGTWHT